MMDERVKQHITMLKTQFSELESGENWVYVPHYPLPENQYNKDSTKLLIIIPLGYPEIPPDDFFVDVDLKNKDGTPIQNFQEGSKSSNGSTVPILEGEWGWFSWHPDSWRINTDIEKGDNLITFLRSVNIRLRGDDQ